MSTTTPLHRLPALLSTLALNPALTGPLLYLLASSPSPLRTRLATQFQTLRDPVRVAALVKALKWLLALGLARAANRGLNSLALNNWRLGFGGGEKERWRWDDEVAVVTGGCSGIGRMVVQKLGAAGVRVAVLDVLRLPGEMEGCMFVVSLFLCVLCCAVLCYAMVGFFGACVCPAYGGK